MFDIQLKNENEVTLSGRFDASKVNMAYEVFNKIDSTSIVDFKDCNYISSAGLSVLLKTQKRLSAKGDELILKNMNKLNREIFKLVGFESIFTIEE